MTEPASRPTNKLLLLIAALVVVIAAIWFLVGRQEPEKTETKVDATDLSGGELIVTEPTPGEVPVSVPDTPMTNVPPSGSGSPAPTGSPSAQ
ncbi:hypothetical protein H0274_14945 [Altererythrobacter sp. CC-YST694]|uniref:hypothetical protein n=1 Tax=Altererythrobacter sp. CC-YST694 TaxID=2755038 RepID=UPI001D01ED80|nr:hypothetical protein [Altererythrobacter sp. CC-YST694]MCB5426557.1 hypothetical protein [Altererythrobacter sp. CC-YST694]